MSGETADFHLLRFKLKTDLLAFCLTQFKNIYYILVWKRILLNLYASNPNSVQKCVFLTLTYQCLSYLLYFLLLDAVSCFKMLIWMCIFLC